MIEKIEELKQEVKDFVANSKEDIESYRLKFISRKGKIKELFESFQKVAPSEKRNFGRSLNELKNFAEEKFKQIQSEVQVTDNNNRQHMVDTSLPVQPYAMGSVHPLTQVRQRFIEIFERMGFNVEEGPEIETDFYNFTALNFPVNHPAREMQDTFFIEKDPDILLRTHTSSVQVRIMESGQLPIRSLMPGRVYRNEAVSARAHCFFNQMEGLFVDENVSFSDMKDTLYHFAKEMYDEHTEIRLRPSYFPFTEPSAELDISCQICHGEGCNICKYTGWVEIGGCGMVDPNVLDACGIDSKKYTGFAFGMGIERITMLKYQINDLRLFSENDVRFLRQF